MTECEGADSDRGGHDPVAERAHAAAMERGDPTYPDPETGYSVMTAATLAAQGRCCGSGCRHCPFPPEEQLRAGRPPV